MTPSPSLPHSPKRKPVPSVIPEGARSFFAPVNILPLSLILPMDGPSASSNKNTPESDKVTSGDVPGPIPELPVSVDVPHDTATSGTPSLPPISVEDVFTDCTTTKPEEVRRTEGEENASEEGQVPSADAIDGDKTEEEVAQS